MSNALAQAARAGFRPVRGYSIGTVHTAKQQGGECCSLILQVSDRNFTHRQLPVPLILLPTLYSSKEDMLFL